jgi:hypothetical protein
MSAPIAKPSGTPVASTPDTAEAITSINVVLSFNIDLRLLRRQKRALIAMPRNVQLSPDQEEAVEGMLNMIDFVQDSIVEQGLASEEEVFPQMPLLFEIAA